MGDDRAALSLAAIVAGIALVLAGIGTSASLSYRVLTRRKELAIRLALGASPGSLMAGVLKEATRLTLVGAGVGAVIAWCIHLSPAATSLFGGPQDLFTSLAEMATVLAASLLAAFVPSFRAAKTAPLAALKTD